MENYVDHGQCPSYFRYGVMQAKQGGVNSYSNPGYHLAIHILELVNDSEEAICQLEQIIDSSQSHEELENSLWNWLENNLSRCTKLIPPKRRRQFMVGILMGLNNIFDWELEYD